MVSPTDSDMVIRTVKLSKTFRDFWLRERVAAVRDLDLNIPPGEVYGLLGPNGSGKSTTLKMILGLMFPTSGIVRVFGRPPTDVAIKARIGFLPEESYLYPFLDAHETLDYYGRLFHQSRPERKRRIEMLLDMVGLAGAAYRRVGEYSKGMQRRIGMAQALINDPELLILDEPTSGMDPLAARQFKDLIVELSRRGKTIILSSHLLADMEDVCNRVGILFAGQLRAEGTLDSLLTKGNLTQIVTDALDPDTVGQVRQVLESAGRRVVSVENPRDKLEAMFLRIIREAQAQKRPGAVATGELAGFLRADAGAPVERTGREVIEELVAQPKVAEPAAPAAEPPPAPAMPAREVIADLVAGRHEQPPAAETPTGQVKPAGKDKAGPAKAVDRSLLDSLVNKPSSEPTDDA